MPKVAIFSGTYRYNPLQLGGRDVTGKFNDAPTTIIMIISDKIDFNKLFHIVLLYI